MIGNFKLRQKFTFLLILIFVGNLLLIGVSLQTILARATEKRIAAKALILMETMNSVRIYTLERIQPELVEQLKVEFLPQAIPNFAVREIFENLRQQPNYRDFFYKDATLNPSNPRDKADLFETELIENFKSNEEVQELRGFRSTLNGNLFYLARPIKVSQPSCLECHSVPSAAPPSLVERYGNVNGFGWKLNEIVGAQIISIPVDRAIDEARQFFFLILGIVSSIFAAVIFLVNVLLNRTVIKPLKRIVRVAEKIATGSFEEKFEELSNDEIGNLAKAITGMKLSLTKFRPDLDR
jgi:methyl-accepting chemotaxis protein